MTAVFFLQILLTLLLLVFTGRIVLGQNSRIRDESFFLKKKTVALNSLPSSALKPLPPGRKPGSRSVGVETSATVAAVVDVRSGKTLLEKKADAPMPLASLTKLMTALVILDSEPDWEKEVAIIETDLRENPSSLRVGEAVTMRDLFYASLVASDNTAVAALVRATGMTAQEFVAKMNAKAGDIGMLNAAFADSTGLNPANTASALDVAALARAAFGRDEIRQALMTSAYILKLKGANEERVIKTTDKLLDGVLNRSPFEIRGGKTGYIEESGFNFVFEVKGAQEQDLIVVVFGSSSPDSRFEEAKNLALWAIENFDWQK